MRSALLPILLVLVGCGDGLEDGEWLPGGETTNTVLLGSNAFLMPARNLTAEHEQDFYSGNSFFNQAWVEAPASTDARDGLGPLFNARSCSGCHFRDGRAAPPEGGEGPFVGVLLRLSVPGPDGPVPDPVYGGQLQDQANPGLPAEARLSVRWEESSGAFADGEPYTLIRPVFTLDDPAYGPLPDDLQISARNAPQMIGLGLLEAIPEADLEALADPDDADGDGISGRIQRHPDGRVGRMGWKGGSPDVAQQVANAFAGDMGLTSRLARADDCTDAQGACTSEPDGGDPEVSDAIFDKVVLYARTVAVPARRAADDRTIRRGKALFGDLGCTACHTPSHTTADAALPELNGQRIWPYTDLLLHDMGPELADDRPVLDASGTEWRTPPLWGLGMLDEVNGHTRLLHDGRARGVAEAVLWHGGEAEAARDAFRALDEEDREAVVKFVEDL